jgi:hypothetical protein
VSLYALGALHISTRILIWGQDLEPKRDLSRFEIWAPEKPQLTLQTTLCARGLRRFPHTDYINNKLTPVPDRCDNTASTILCLHRYRDTIVAHPKALRSTTVRGLTFDGSCACALQRRPC